MTDFQLVFQAHPETFCTFIFPLHSNLKLICQIEIHITHAPTNVKEVELKNSLLSTVNTYISSMGRVILGLYNNKTF